MREGKSSGPGKVHIQTPGKQGAFGLVEAGASTPRWVQNCLVGDGCRMGLLGLHQAGESGS